MGIRRGLLLVCLLHVLVVDRIQGETTSGEPADVPAWARAAFEQGLSAARQQDWPVSIQHFEAALHSAPLSPTVLFNLALAEAQVPGRELRAICWFEAYLAVVPRAANAAAVRQEIAQLEARAEANGRKLAQLAIQLTDQLPADDDAKRTKASLLGKMGDLTAAEATLASITSPDQAKFGQRDLVNDLINAWRFADALKLAGHLPDFDGWAVMANAQIVAGLFADARESIGRVAPRSERLYSLTDLVAAEFAAGDVRAAQKDLEAAKAAVTNVEREQTPDNAAEMLQTLAGFEAFLGEPDQAQATLARAKAASPSRASIVVLVQPDVVPAISDANAWCQFVDGFRSGSFLEEEGIEGNLSQPIFLDFGATVAGLTQAKGWLDRPTNICLACDQLADQWLDCTTELHHLRAFLRRTAAIRSAAYFDRRGRAAAASGDHQQALTEFKAALQVDPQDAAAFIGLGRSNEAMNHPDAALTAYDRAVQLAPDDAAAYYWRGMFERQESDPHVTEAIADFDRAIALDSTDALAFHDRGETKLLNSDPDGAIADFDRAVTLNPKDAASLEGRAQAKEAKHDLSGAIADWDRAIALGSPAPGLSISYYGRGADKLALGDLKGAIDDLSRSIALGGHDADAEIYRIDAYMARANARRLAGDLAGALADCNAVYGIYEDIQPNCRSRAEIKTLLGDWTGALADYRHYCTLAAVNPDYPQLYIWLLRARLGDSVGAGKDLQAYLDGRPATQGADWVAQLGGFLLGRVTESELLSAASHVGASDVLRERCEATCFAGLKELLEGHRQAAASFFRQCLSTKQAGAFEYQWAQSELRSLAP